MVDRPLLLIVGVQKSGTTLLSRLVQEEGVARSPFKTEGNDFFGNEPPFAPTGEPVGAAYQRHRGERGHEMDAADATPDARALLHARLAELDGDVDPIVNKNPYNTVRLGWLRSMFAPAVIVAMVRDPVANAYSLAKKYTDHDGRGLPPDEGFWGVKPAGWRGMVEDDKGMQSAAQWDAVNRRLLADIEHVDRIIRYDLLCARPADVLADLDRRLRGDARTFDVAPFPCFDDEHGTGARLQSKNRDYKKTGSLREHRDGKVEFPPLTGEQADAIRARTIDTWTALRDAAR